MSEKNLNISIRIADLPRRILMQIPPSQEEFVRRAEDKINDLWRKWSKMDDFKDKTSAEILAMVTIRFAHLYFSAEEASKRVDRTLEDLEKSLDRVLFDIEAAGGSQTGKS